MSKIQIELNDWLYNAGVVGLINILRHNEEKVKILNKQCIEIDSDQLQDFEKKYFDFFIDKYLKFTSWYKITSFEDYLEKIDVEKITKDDIDKLNKYIEYLKLKVKLNSFKSAYLLANDASVDILSEEKHLKKISIGKKQTLQDEKVKENIINNLNSIHKIIDNLCKENLKRYVLSKNIIYDVIANFWGGVSFLHTSKNNSDMYSEYKEYFVDGVVSYTDLDKSKDKYNCFTCNNTLSKLSKPIAYELAWINKTGVDMSRKSSHFWDMKGDAYICPICNLIYSCIPAGFTVLKGKGLFINKNTGINTLTKINNQSLDNVSSIEELEENSYFNIVDNMEQGSISQVSKEIDNIQIVKLNSQNERRPYTFNIISKDKLKIINKHKEQLKSMIKIHIKISKDDYLNLYNEVLNRLYNGHNLFDLIYKLIYLNLNGNFKNTVYIDMILKINNDLIGGGKMSTNKIDDKVISNCRSYGYYLREEYVQKGAKHKLGGISYRLLNALKTKNVARFMDTLFNSYMYLNKQIPARFAEVLNDKVKFQTIGYAFLLGLQGGSGKNNNENEKKEDISNE
ncbi:type I-B CRISPR-associated protein Cas8b1/Cst1 [Clostridium botulinum D/C]|uniref:type I-B CRISPR-associated protein Cas8b1/Cst1 n=1 Tax=Clostridium botulinum TaxID=1491 RepID=UPI001E44D38C|nr:type I-B CRISPR-associated protein Cas8b1/Cst1 [Clostridium botulinum]MCD3352072.1 type I-B CRISPR-associated protein Cas8b1/Cst1 [Clostridium botulinum D/C]MCD3361020.1 type I-B CRISPR-associated protein Cas8b1/Cst1 [Clostridium botulinum D/C]MCD3362926.1 type I-B CRISPR-associated protein Cas8b1/Cst1 [Clostridium botulinum D/C]MCD3366762.1 type I-B CRISPR-associated protein Cas8b1/Cst1 [Clostridium botulinum D/C]